MRFVECSAVDNDQIRIFSVKDSQTVTSTEGKQRSMKGKHTRLEEGDFCPCDVHAKTDKGNQNISMYVSREALFLLKQGLKR